MSSQSRLGCNVGDLVGLDGNPSLGEGAKPTRSSGSDRVGF